jgi:hypothetical protein
MDNLYFVAFLSQNYKLFIISPTVTRLVEASKGVTPILYTTTAKSSYSFHGDKILTIYVLIQYQIKVLICSDIFFYF